MSRITLNSLRAANLTDKTLVMNLTLCALSLLLTISSSVFAEPAVISGSDLFDGHPVAVRAGPMGTVVVFLSSECPCSKSHIGEIKSLKNDYPELQFVAVHANGDETREKTLAYFKEQELGFPLLRDRHHDLAERFKANKTPHAFVLNSAGEVIYRGGVTDSKDCRRAGRKLLREALEDVKAKRAVRTAESRTLGCAISRSDGDW